MYLRSLKGKLVLFIGFIIGFIVTLYLASIIDNYCDYKTNNCHDKSLQFHKSNKNSYNGNLINEKLIIRGVKSSYEDINLSKDTEESLVEDKQKLEYEKWLKDNNIKLSNMDLDHQYYGSLTEKSNYTTSLLESEWLKSKINIICVVFVDKVKLARAIYNTWSTNCNKIYFFSHKLFDNQLPMVKLSVNITSSWQLLCESMHYVWNLTNDSLQWIIFVKDDTIVLLENLRYYVAPLNYNEGYYLGHPVILWGQAYNVAQAGYVLSRGSVKKIINHFNTHDKCLSGGKYWKQEDYYLGKHLSKFNIHPSDTRDYKLRDKFHGYSLQTLLWGLNKLGNYFTHALYPTGRDCCSPKSITFNVPDVDRLYTINYYLYHLFVYNEEGKYGNKPAPTPVPEHEVWKLVLRDEFNITNYNNITNDLYFKIWKFKYVDPTQIGYLKDDDYSNITNFFEALWSKQESGRMNNN
ncbi:glycoprotein-N-acetylgalactosamine 3-beta-galactosyltransferase 1-like [Microplitis mediator]|uniref:glycoprotein-N-acetylgalactosamine 3-beta-galactosyltransferase 1-like n=1 Tax=Microplitis mediator TaxID=375433 RepID=UPI0025533955|nr:glycoprotein-N-acetylgalactosamine 3-beta-galactosyltransferase 1-like [Microplitis mediator]